MNCIKCKGPLAYYERSICIKCISDEHGGVDIDALKLILKASQANHELWDTGHRPEVIIDHSKLLEKYKPEVE